MNIRMYLVLCTAAMCCMQPSNNNAVLKKLLSLKELSLRALMQKPRVIDRRKLDQHKALLDDILYTVICENSDLEILDSDFLLYVKFAGEFNLNEHIEYFADILVQELNSKKTKIYEKECFTPILKKSELWNIITSLPDPLIQAVRNKCNSR